MADFNEALKTVSQAILRRELSEGERAEFLELGAALGMNTVEDYLYILMIFKRYSDVIGQKLDEMSAYEQKINHTLESTVERILGEGAARIGAGMGDTIAERSKEVMASVDEFYLAKGLVVASSVTGILAALAYWIGLSGAFIMDDIGGLFRNVLIMPAGWWMFVSVASYMYFWCFDNWSLIKTSTYHQCLLGFQIVLMLVLFLSML